MKRRELLLFLGVAAATVLPSVQRVDASVKTLTSIELPANFQ